MNKQQLIAALEAAKEKEPLFNFHDGINHGLDKAISLVRQLSEPAGWQDISTVPVGIPVLIHNPNDTRRPLMFEFSEIETEEWKKVDDETQKLIRYKGAGSYLERKPASFFGTHWHPFPLPPAPSPEQKGGE